MASLQKLLVTEIKQTQISNTFALCPKHFPIKKFAYSKTTLLLIILNTII